MQGVGVYLDMQVGGVYLDMQVGGAYLDMQGGCISRYTKILNSQF